MVAFPVLPCARPFIYSVAARETVGEDSERTEEKERERERRVGGEVQLRPYNFVADALLSRIYRDMNSNPMPRLNFGESSVRTRVCAPVHLFDRLTFRDDCHVPINSSQQSDNGRGY